MINGPRDTSDKPAEAPRRSLVEWIAAVLSTIAALGLLPLVGLTVADVTRRQTTGNSILGAFESIEVGMVCVVFLAMMGAQVNKRHIRTPIVTNRLPSQVAHVVRLVGCLLAAAFVMWLTYETAVVAQDSFGSREFRAGVVRVPIWPARVCIPIGMAGFGLALLAEAWGLVRRIRSREQADFVEVESNL